MNIDNLLNPAQSAEQELEIELDLLVQRGCLQGRDRMDLEELLNPDGEHGGGMQTRIDEEIVEALQRMDLENADHDDEIEAEVCIVSRNEALRAAEILQSFMSTRTDKWA